MPIDRTLAATILATLSLFLVSVAPAFAASTEKLLYSFCSGNDCADGSQPLAGLIFDAAGNLYGTAEGGAYGAGVVFELTPGGNGTWTETVLYNFCTLSGCADGGGPASSSLIFDAAGNLYGTTASGGAYQENCGGHACGTVFELSPNGDGTWTETVLHSFGNGTDGREPAAGLIFDHTGSLYGTTAGGGARGSGTVFELTPGKGGAWTETTVHNFCSAHHCKDGAAPQAPVIFDSSGNLYGTTALGGFIPKEPCGHQGCGVAFELITGASGTWKEKTLHTFNANDGKQPMAALIFDSAGDLYGTTFLGGPHGKGTVFELSPAKNGTWTEKVLASKNLGPTAGLVFDSSGNLYGTSGSGGYGDGAVFKLTPGQKGKWTLKLLYKFNPNGQDGDGPNADLIFDTAGNLYSTTTGGGASGSGCGGHGCGTVFEITP